MEQQKRLKFQGALHSATLMALLAATVACSGLAQRGELRNMGQNTSTSSESPDAGIAQRNRASADTVAREIESCPPWSELKQEDSAKRQQIPVCLEKIANYDLEDIQQGMEKYVSTKRSQKAFDVSAMSRLYLLNRYVFDVPAKASFDSPTFGGWMGVPHDSQSINLLWPLTVDEEGKLTLTGKFGVTPETIIWPCESSITLKKNMVFVRTRTKSSESKNQSAQVLASNCPLDESSHIV